jgi:hypothetical protein
MFSDKNKAQIAEQGIDITVVEKQIQYFVDGFPFMPLKKAAIIDKGIVQLTDDQKINYIDLYDKKAIALKIVKFVPASGAASRMFKSLFTALEENKSDKSVAQFFAQLDQFAFAKELKATAKSGAEEDLLRSLLLDYGLGYGGLPKGLLAFHQYNGQARTPVEEHLVEGASYAFSNGKVYLHLTVSPEHKPKFEQLIASKIASYEQLFGLNFVIEYSEQRAATDTIAVNLDNTPFLESDGRLLFRPAGHGALLANLNDIEADIIFIKNIDNVVPDRLKPATVEYKKAIAGLILELQAKIFDYLQALKYSSPTAAEMDEIDAFLQKQLCVLPPSGLSELSNQEKSNYYFEKLNRPLRICGMVKNQGEPGGGPFWCSNNDGTVSLQVVESAQVDMKDCAQKEIFTKSTHFNPVDLVCATKDFEGNKFNLMHFSDPKTGFITEKSKDGKALKAQELPGLWNGAMANWNTIFVEVPLITFNPVKTINDLLREEHQ